MDNDITKGLIETDETDERIFLQLVDKYRIHADSKYDEHDWLLYRHDIGFSPRGNIMVIAAEKKAGKTWMGMSICAAALSGNFLGMTSKLENGRVIFFDTEQDPIDGQRIQRRVHYAMRTQGWDFERDDDRFMLFHLREVNAADRREFVNRAIRYYEPDLVFVDGIRDLLTDFNDLEQSAEVIQDLMTLSTECKCAIWTVLHVNPGSEKMRGHLGTEMGNKVADILYMTKDRDQKNEDNITYKVEETDSRGHKDIKSITFRINDSLPYGIPEELTAQEVVEIEENREQELRDTLDEVMGNRAMSKTAIREQLKSVKHMGTKKADSLIAEATKCGVLESIIQSGKLRVTHPIVTKQDDVPF